LSKFFLLPILFFTLLIVTANGAHADEGLYDRADSFIVDDKFSNDDKDRRNEDRGNHRDDDDRDRDRDKDRDDDDRARSNLRKDWLDDFMDTDFRRHDFRDFRDPRKTSSHDSTDRRDDDRDKRDRGEDEPETVSMR